MNRSKKEEFSDIQTALRALDRDIPVPYRATTEGLRSRLSAAPEKGSSRFYKKLIPTLASLLLVAAVGVFAFPMLDGAASFKLANETAPAEAPMEAAPASSFAADAMGTVEEVALESEMLDKIAEQKQAHSTVKPDSSANAPTGNPALFRNASNYEDIKVALMDVIAAQSSSSSSMIAEEILDGADSSFSLAAGSYQYTLTCTPEGEARLTIRSNSDDSILSVTDLNCVRGSLFLKDDRLILAGEGEDKTVLQVFDISDLSCPILEKTMVQEGVFLGTWFTENAMLVASLYQVDSMDKIIPSVNGEMLSAEQIFLTDEAITASYAVVSAIPIYAEADTSTFAVLGGSDVEFYAGELTVTVGGGEKMEFYANELTVSQPQAGKTEGN